MIGQQRACHVGSRGPQHVIASQLPTHVQQLRHGETGAIHLERSTGRDSGILCRDRQLVKPECGSAGIDVTQLRCRAAIAGEIPSGPVERASQLHELTGSDQIDGAAIRETHNVTHAQFAAIADADATAVGQRAAHRIHIQHGCIDRKRSGVTERSDKPQVARAGRARTRCDDASRIAQRRADAERDIVGAVLLEAH